MSDKYNFSKHLSQIVKPVFRQLGFRKKGAIFTKEIDGVSYAFDIARSSWNGLPDRPDELSIHVRVVTTNLNSTVLLHRITNKKFPSRYAPFFQDTLEWTEKSKLMQSFSETEMNEIDSYLDSISWKYKKEEELITILQELKDQIIKVGVPTISMAESLVNKELDSFDFSNEMRKYSSQLFLSQLKPDSRFPED